MVFFASTIFVTVTTTKSYNLRTGQNLTMKSQIDLIIQRKFVIKIKIWSSRLFFGDRQRQNHHNWT